MDVVTYALLKKKISGASEENTQTRAMISGTETTNKASKAYSVGEHLIHNNVLYEVTSPISKNGTLKSGTNISPVDVGSELTSLQNQITGIEAEVSGISDGFTYKGSVATFSNLPASGNELGDMYTVTASGNAKYVYNGTGFALVDGISTEEIDAFYT